MTTPTGGAPMEKKSMNSPDETRTFEKGKLELTTFKNGTAIGRITLEPGWSWDKCVKPIVKTNSCRFRIISKHKRKRQKREWRRN
jgi:hypothetical protein